MSDNIVRFPIQKGSFHLEESPDLLNIWEAGLLSDSHRKQWLTFEQMFAFSDPEVGKIVEQFLLHPSGEKLLKTKCLQAVKQAAASKKEWGVMKEEQIAAVSIEEVPVHKLDWQQKWLKPIHLLEQMVYDDPSLVQLAEELWLLLLEKNYPFLQEFEEALIWTAALHFYILKTVDQERAELEVSSKLPERYRLTEEQIIVYSHKLEEHLK